MPPFLARWLGKLALLLVVFGAGAVSMLWLSRPKAPPLPDPPALVEKIREVARLETLDVRLYKKVSFEPMPTPADTVWGDLFNWARQSIAPQKGKAIVFADVHLGLDLSKLTAEGLRVQGERVEVSLPPLRAQVELRPGETEVAGSNLDSAQTAKLFELAKEAFEREALADPALQARARASAERSIRALLVTLGFKEVVFVQQQPLAPPR